MPRYLNPKNDVPFKKIFGEHAHLLISLLNALLPLKEGQQIVDVTYLLPAQMPETILGKRSEVDVKCRDTQGRTFIVEMQMHWSPDFAQRMVFNASRVLVKQLDKVKLEDVAKAFKDMQPVYSLALVVDRFEPKDGKRWYYHYKVADIKKPTRTIEGMEFIVVDFENFKLNHAGLRGWTPDKRHMAVLWLRFLTEMYEGATPDPDLLKQKEVEEALKICEVGAYSPNEMQAYEDYWTFVHWERTWVVNLEDAKKELAEKDEKLAEKDEKLAAQAEKLAEKDEKLAAQAAENEALKQQLAALKKGGS